MQVVVYAIHKASRYFGEPYTGISYDQINKTPQFYKTEEEANEIVKLLTEVNPVGFNAVPVVIDYTDDKDLFSLKKFSYIIPLEQYEKYLYEIRKNNGLQRINLHLLSAGEYFQNFENLLRLIELKHISFKFAHMILTEVVEGNKVEWLLNQPNLAAIRENENKSQSNSTEEIYDVLDYGN
jgi:hypothetical protein